MRSLLFTICLLALAACGASMSVVPSPAPGDDGERLFTVWCLGCHALEEGAPATVGPNLAGVATLAAANPDGLSAEEWLRREILDPNAVITQGYTAGLMPTNYGQILRPEHLDALVAYMLTLE